MTRQDFRRAYRLARLVVDFENAMGHCMRWGDNELAQSVPTAGYLAARMRAFGDPLRYPVHIAGRRRFSGPRQCLPGGA